jgi:mannose-6-phosphate isomerase
LNRIVLLKNEIKEYHWGSRIFIPQLTGMRSPCQRPQAEMWLGAHPGASSMATVDNKQIRLREIIKNDPVGALGKSVSDKFSGDLPFLFKVLSAARPLSLQAHPNKAQARLGFAREDSKDIPIESPHRTYKDQNHKPEMICALTHLWAFKGFRRNKDIIDLMDMVGASSVGVQTELLRRQDENEGLKGFFTSLLTMEKGKQEMVIEKIMGIVNGLEASEPAFEWIIKLYREFPGDIGVLSPLFLNVVCLEPMEAIYITSGELHGYLEGSGLELMANSDNVIRGGLTPKHVDVKELLDILDFAPHEPEIIRPEQAGNNEAIYRTGNHEFVLSVITLHGGGREGSIYRGPAARGPEIIICTEGKANITDINKRDSLDISKGLSFFIPASVEAYIIKGEATIFKAAVPVPKQLPA